MSLNCKWIDESVSCTLCQVWCGEKFTSALWNFPAMSSDGRCAIRALEIIHQYMKNCLDRHTSKTELMTSSCSWYLQKSLPISVCVELWMSLRFLLFVLTRWNFFFYLCVCLLYCFQSSYDLLEWYRKCDYYEIFLVHRNLIGAPAFKKPEVSLHKSISKFVSSRAESIGQVCVFVGLWHHKLVHKLIRAHCSASN